MIAIQFIVGVLCLFISQIFNWVSRFFLFIGKFFLDWAEVILVNLKDNDRI